MPVDDEDVRLVVYRHFMTTGRGPDDGELAAALGLPAGEAQASVRRLADARHVVLGDDGQIVMAHPFSAVPLGFAVMGAGTLWWGGCAWDSFALPHLLPGEPEVLVSTRCPGCGPALGVGGGTRGSSRGGGGGALPRARVPHVGLRRAHMLAA